MMKFGLFLLIFCAALTILTRIVMALDGKRPLQYQKSDVVVKLVDANFEHQTQASTGQTTGSWLLWFYDTGDKTIIEGAGSDEPTQEEEAAEDKPEILNDSFWTDNNLVLGVVHAQLARDTAKRFNIDISSEGGGVPCFLFLHKGKLYRYDGKNDWESLQQFVLEGYSETNGENVPPPRGHVAKLIELLRETVVGHIVLAGLVIVMLAFLFYTMAVASLLREERKDKKS